MAPEKLTKEEFWTELEALGEDEVHTRVHTKIYSEANNKLPLAKEWLRLKEKNRQGAKDAANLEAARSASEAAKRAAAAAESQADTARRALKTAKIATGIAAAAMIIAAISIFVP